MHLVSANSTVVLSRPELKCVFLVGQRSHQSADFATSKSAKMSAMLSLGLLRTKFKPSLKAKDLQCFDPTKMGKEPPIPIIPERTKPF